MSMLRLDHEPWPEIFHENWTACLRTLGRSQWPMYGTGDLRNGKGAEHRTCVVANVRTSAGAEFRTCGTPRVRSYAPAEWRTCGTPHWWRPGVMNVVESVREFWPQRIFQISKRYLRYYFIFFGPVVSKSAPVHESAPQFTCRPPDGACRRRRRLPMFLQVRHIDPGLSHGACRLRRLTEINLGQRVDVPPWS